MALSETLEVHAFDFHDACESAKAVLDSEEQNHERSAHLSSGSTAEIFFQLSVATSRPDKFIVKWQKDVISAKPT